MELLKYNFILFKRERKREQNFTSLLREEGNYLRFIIVIIRNHGNIMTVEGKCYEVAELMLLRFKITQETDTACLRINASSTTTTRNLYSVSVGGSDCDGVGTSEGEGVLHKSLRSLYKENN